MTNTATDTQHTPGPWYVSGSSHRDYEGAEIGTGNRTVAVILTADAAEETGEEAANARLVAAAPELLDALEGLVFSLSPRKVVPVLKAAGYSTDLWKMAYRQARAVIDRARQ